LSKSPFITNFLFILTSICACCFSKSTHAQISLDQILIGSGFSEYSNGNNFTLSASVGEPIITTQTTTDLIITQGFQQSNYVINNPFVVSLTATNAACIGANDGFITVSFISSNIAEPYIFQWSNGASTRDIAQLEVGEYSVTITGSNGNRVTNTAFIEADQIIDCAPQFYTGLTPNGDNDNDNWFIENADFFTTKKLEVFNRYGIRVWRTNDYNNVNDFFSGNHTNGNKLPDGTYYYIAEFDNSTYRGFIEITR